MAQQGVRVAAEHCSGAGGRRADRGQGAFARRVSREVLDPLAAAIVHIQGAIARCREPGLSEPLRQIETLVREAADALRLMLPASRGGARRPAHEEAHGGSPKRVLLVDDHEVFRQGLASLLAGEPDIVVVGEAGDGRMAMALARELKPDVVVMDVGMPLLNGVEATRWLMAELPGTRIIALSAHERWDLQEAMREAGAVAYLPKGGSGEELVGVIRGLGQPAATDRIASSKRGRARSMTSSPTQNAIRK